MSNPLTAICAAYVAYKAHDVEPLATIGKMWVAYKIFKFLNNLCYDRGIDRGTDFGTSRLLGRAVNFIIKSAQSRTINQDGSITYTYQLGGSKPVVLHRIDYAKTSWGKADAILSKMFYAVPFIAVSAIAITYFNTFICPQTTGSGPQSALFNPDNDTINLYKTKL